MLGGAGYGLGKLANGAKNAISGSSNIDDGVSSFADLMSPDEAARYNKQWANKEAQAAQQQQIKQFEEGLKNGAKYTNQQKGNYGEMKMDQHYESLGFERVSNEQVTNLNTKGHQGIDGVYKNRTTGEYIVAEAKYTTSSTAKPSLGKTADGKQMGSNWIENRIDAAVSDKNIVEQIMKGNYESDLYHLRGNGAVNMSVLN